MLDSRSSGPLQTSVIGRKPLTLSLLESASTFQVKSWAVSPELYPTELKPETLALIEKAVQSAVAAWGSRQVSRPGRKSRVVSERQVAPF